MTDELRYPGLVKRGSKGKPARRVQEWLCLHGHNIAVDGDFGPATESALRKFQRRKRIAETGTANRASFDALVEPMIRAGPAPPGAGTPRDRRRTPCEGTFGPARAGSRRPE